MPRVRANGELATVAFVNTSIDRQDAVGVRQRGVPATVQMATWHHPEVLPVQIPVVHKGLNCVSNCRLWGPGRTATWIFGQKTVKNEASSGGTTVVVL